MAITETIDTMLRPWLILALGLLGCTTTVELPVQTIPTLSGPKRGALALFVAPSVARYRILNKPPVISSRSFEIKAGEALAASIEGSMKGVTSNLVQLSSRRRVPGAEGVLAVDEVELKISSSPNGRCRAKLRLHFHALSPQATDFKCLELKAEGLGNEHRGIVRYKESLATAVARAIEKLTKQFVLGVTQHKYLTDQSQNKDSPSLPAKSPPKGPHEVNQ